MSNFGTLKKQKQRETKLPSMTKFPMWLQVTTLGVLAITVTLRYGLSSPFSSSNYNDEQSKCNCDTLDFPKRTTEESQQMKAKRWINANDYVSKNQLTFMEVDALAMHRDLLDELETKGVPGMILECGVAKAGSSITFAAAKHPKRCLHLFDPFEGIPEPSERDGQDVHDRYNEIQAMKHKCKLGSPDCDKSYYGNMDNLLEYVKGQFKKAGYNPQKNSVFFHKGLFDNTVLPEGPVAYAHLDGDWYDSTKSMLERIAPHLSVGGYVVLDDAFQWSGARKAFVEFFNVNLEWLHQSPYKECLAEQDGKQYILSLAVRAKAKLIDSSGNAPALCRKATKS